MSWHSALIRLQDIDLKFQTMNQRLTEIEARLLDQSELLQAQQEARQRAKAVQEAKGVQKELEFELGRVQAKLKQTEQRLYGGSVTNSRELEDLQAEYYSLQRRKASLEDELLEAMVVREEADETAREAESHLDGIKSRCEERQHALTVEREQLRAHGQVLLEEASQLKKRIPALILDSYHYLKDRTGGVPVARLEGEVCSICGMEVSRPTQRKVRSGEEAYCDGCRRLLVS
jgi:hypothetical protein